MVGDKQIVMTYLVQQTKYLRSSENCSCNKIIVYQCYLGLGLYTCQGNFKSFFLPFLFFLQPYSSNYTNGIFHAHIYFSIANNDEYCRQRSGLIVCCMQEGYYLTSERVRLYRQCFVWDEWKGTQSAVPLLTQ